MSPSSTPLHQLDGERRTRIITFACVAALTVLGFYLRFRCLGCLGFRGDEDLTALAVKALAENGIPQLPSGMIYPRFYLYQWILVFSVDNLGFSEFSMRLPGVLFGTALIPVSYWVTREMFDRRTALIVAAAIALSFTQVDMARTARMYVPFFVVYVLAAFTIFRVHYQNMDRIFSPWVLLLAALALSLHQLAYPLAILLILALPLRPTVARTSSLLIQAGAVGVAFLLSKSIEGHFFYRARQIADSDVFQPDMMESNGGIFQAILQQVSLPNYDLLMQVSQALPAVILGIVSLYIVCVVWAMRALRGAEVLQKVLALLALTLSVAHQFNLVLMILALMLITRRAGIGQMKDPAWYKTALSCAGLFLLWIIAIVLLSVGQATDVVVADQGFRKLSRALVDYPNFRLFWSFALEHPLLIVPLGLGTLWGIDRIAREKPDPTALFLVGGFWLVLFMNGIIETKFEFFRYNQHLDVFFLMLATVGILEIPTLIARLGWRIPGILTGQGSKLATGAIATIMLIVSVNPLAAALTSSRDYRETGYFYRAFGIDVYPDFATPAAFVRERLDPEDRIFVLDPREYWNYIGRVDFWIYSDNYQSQTFTSGGQAFDLYLGIPVLHDEAKVRSAIKDAGVGDIWVLYSKSRLDRTRWISDPLKEFLRSLHTDVVYTGRDKETVVIRLAPDHPIRQRDDDSSP